MKYVLILLVFFSQLSFADDKTSFRFKYSALTTKSNLNFNSTVDVYAGDFLLVSEGAQQQTIELNESLSVIEVGTTYNFGYLIFSADYAFNLSGDEPQKGEHEYTQQAISDPIFDRGDITFSNTVKVLEVDYSSAQASIGFGNGYINLFGGFRLDTHVSTIKVDTSLAGLDLSQNSNKELVLDSVVKGPFVGVSFLFDVGVNKYLATKISVTQYESGHMMLSNDNVTLNKPATGNALSIASKFTGKTFFIGLNSRFYESDKNSDFSMERMEYGIEIGVYWL